MVGLMGWGLVGSGFAGDSSHFTFHSQIPAAGQMYVPPCCHCFSPLVLDTLSSIEQRQTCIGSK